MHLENGIKQAFNNPFYAEEKVDGYNVRIVKVQGHVFTFTRGSYVCPFITDRLVDFFDYDSFFKENPNLIVCGEIAGHENPYNAESPPYTASDIKGLKEHIQYLNEKGCEGLVFKPTDPFEKTVKYVTAESCLRDMKVTSTLMTKYQAVSLLIEC